MAMFLHDAMIFYYDIPDVVCMEWACVLEKMHCTWKLQAGEEERICNKESRKQSSEKSFMVNVEFCRRNGIHRTQHQWRR